MSLVPIDKILDTIISWMDDQRPVFNTIISRFYTRRTLSIFLGRRDVVPMSSTPSIEVAGVAENLGWHACRVQFDEPTVEIDITNDNTNPDAAARLEAAMVNLTTRILASPIHLLPRIQSTNTHFYDAIPSSVRYSSIGHANQRVATITWTGKYIEYLRNRLFQPELRILPPPDFPSL